MHTEDPNNKLRKILHYCRYGRCSKWYTSAHKLASHVSRNHLADKPFVCLNDDCMMIFKRRIHLENHVRTQHTPSNTVICPHEDCQTEFLSEASMKRHVMMMHVKKNFEFIEEEENFSPQNGAEMKAPVPNSRNLTAVPVVKKPNKIVPVKRKPQKPNHAVNIGKSPQRDPIPIQTVDPTGKTVFICPFHGCGREFGDGRKVKVHMSNVHQHITCQYCTRVFSSKTSFTKHICVSKGSKTKDYICPHDGCDRSYSYINNLKFHLTHYHNKSNFSCPWDGCTRTFSYKASLNRHIRNDHQNDEIFVHSRSASPASSRGSVKKNSRKSTINPKKVENKGHLSQKAELMNDEYLYNYDVYISDDEN